MARRQGFGQLRPRLISVAVASCFATGTVFANPTGPTVVNGTAAIHQAGNLLQVTNSPNAIINWQSFSIGASEITRFIQQSQASAVLNRVTGVNGAIDPSVILGALQSNGRVFLINPSGVLFGAGAQVDVAGLVAASLNLSNTDFLAGRLNFTNIPGAGSIANQGNITTSGGGNVYLVGPAVTNSGIITSPQGEVVLAAGNSVELVNPATPNLRIEVNALDNEAKNLGQIIADSGRVGIVAGLINHSGTTRADSAVSEGGRILLKATKAVTLEDSSVLSAKGTGGGEIKVLGGDAVRVAGTLDASAPVSGDGGFIETSAKQFSMAAGTIISTAAANGKAGTWLIDPTDFLIAAINGDMTGADLSAALGTNSVVITSDGGEGGINGEILVNDTVSWATNNSLTLTARGALNVNSGISSTGSGTVALYAGWDGISPATSPVILCCAEISLNAPLSVSAAAGTGGAVSLVSGGNINQVAGAPVTADKLLAVANFGNVLMNAATNQVNTLAGQARQQFLLKNGRSLTIDTISGVPGVQVGGGGPATVDISLTSGDLTVNSPVTASASSGSDANVTLTAAGGITVNSLVQAAGGDGTDGSNGGQANVTLSAGTGISVIGTSVRAQGGDGSSDYGGAASVTMNAGTSIAINNSLVEAVGGLGSVSWRRGDALVSMTGPAGVTIENNSSVNADGRYAEVDINANNAAAEIKVKNSAINAGADGAEGSIHANATGAGGKITVENSSIYAYDNNGGFALVEFNSGSGGISVDGGEGITVQSYGGFGNAVIDLSTTGPVNIGTASGTGVRAYVDGGEGGADIYIGGSTVTVNNSFVQSYAGSNSFAGVEINASGPIDIKGTAGEVRAEIGCAECFGGMADVLIESTGGNVNIDRPIVANGDGGDGFVTILAPQGAITTSATLGTGGFVGLGNSDPFNSEIVLVARNGIGTIANPIRIDNYSDGDITLQNTGATGDIAVSLFNTPFNEDCIGLPTVCIDGDLNGLINNNPSGTYFVRAEGGDIRLEIPFTPNGLPLGAGQKVHFNAPDGKVILAGPASGEITGAAQVTLEALNLVQLEPSTSVSAGNVVLRANDMDIQGTVSATAPGGSVSFVPFTPGTTIDLGGAGGGSLGLSNAELQQISAAGGLVKIGDPMTLDSPITISGAVTSPGYAWNLYGSNISQSAPIAGPALNVLASDSIVLDNAGNNVGVVQLNSIGDAPVSFTNSGSFTIASLTSVDGPVSATAASGNLTIGGASGNITVSAGTADVTLTSTSGAIVDGHDGLDIVGNTATLTAPGGIGTFSNPLETSVLNIALNSTGASTNQIGILNAGDLTVNSLSFNGDIAGVGATTMLAVGSPINVTGNLGLGANTSMTISNGVSASGDLFLQSPSLTVLGAMVTGNNVGLSGSTVSIVEGTASANNVMQVNTGVLNVTGPGALLSGLEVNITAGSLINITGPYAQIAAGAPSTINILFPTLGSGGFMVNNVAGVVDPGDTGSGFFVVGNQVTALGFPGFNVIYGTASVLPPPVDQAINQVIAATNQQTESNSGKKEEPAASNETGEPTGDKDKKSLPVCN